MSVVRSSAEIDKGIWMLPLTFPTGIRLDELLLRAGFLEFGGQPSQLGQDFIDKTDFRGKVVLVEVEGKVAPDESWGTKSVSPP